MILLPQTQFSTFLHFFVKDTDRSSFMDHLLSCTFTGLRTRTDHEVLTVPPVTLTSPHSSPHPSLQSIPFSLPRSLPVNSVISLRSPEDICQHGTCFMDSLVHLAPTLDRTRGEGAGVWDQIPTKVDLVPHGYRIGVVTRHPWSSSGS